MPLNLSLDTRKLFYWSPYCLAAFLWTSVFCYKKSGRSRLPFRAETYIVGLLVNLVTDHISSSFCPSAQRDVGVFCNVLVSFLRGSRTGTLYGFGNIVGGVPIGSVSEDLSIINSKGQQRGFPRLRRTACMTEQLGRGSIHT